MCGIAGALAMGGAGPWRQEQILATVSGMSDAIAHRGPDDHGLWVDGQGQIALGHRRLAIVDLSPRGKQPMHYGDRFVIVFNGEIYNHRELRAELRNRGHSFNSETDTEVLMAAVREWGVERALGRLVGMFAFALWDCAERTLLLARDRLGEKPLFVASVHGHLLFASELRALEGAVGSHAAISRQALSHYLSYGYVPAPLSMREGIYKLPVASLLMIDPTQSCDFSAGDDGSLQVGAGAQLRRYWEPPCGGDPAKITQGADDAPLDELQKLVDSSVLLQMQSDVPMGVFLSGGIDSTVVAASAQSLSTAPISTFTVRFEVPGFDESEHAAAISRRLNTSHHEISLTPQRLIESIPALASSLDEPTANASYFPLHVMASEARRSVKVILTGDAGDELFGGYNRYRLTGPLWRKVSRLPLGVRLCLARALEQPWGSGLVRMLGVAQDSGISGQVQGNVALKKLIRVLRSASLAESYQRLLQCWDSPSAIAHVTDVALQPRNWSQEAFLRGASSMDLAAYLPDDNLAKSDRATMAAGLEARVPLLDHRIVEFACRLPDQFKIRAGTSKWLLRELAYRRVPRELLERPKMGFTVPIDSWLKGPLSQWAGDLFSSRGLLERGMLRPRQVADAWQDYTKGRMTLGWEIWSILMYLAWLDGRRTDMRPVG